MNPALVATSTAELGSLAAAVVADALAGGGSVAFSGGTTPAVMLRALAERPGLDWSTIDVYQVDERVAPAGHADRNLTMLEANLADRALGARVHAMPVDEPDLDVAAVAYAAVLPQRIDVVVLGLGDDGHTASLVPDDPVLDIDDTDVALTGRYGGRTRMTLTYPAIERARRVIWLVQGPAKREALARLRAGDRGIPAGRVRADRALVVTDHAAAGTG